VGQQAADEYAALTAPGGEVEQIGREIAALNDTIKRFVTAGDTPNDLMDQRDVLLDKLAALGTTSIVGNADGSVDVTFGGAGAPMVDAAGYHAEPLGASPGGRLGALKELSAVPGGLVDSYRVELGAVAQTLAAAVNAIHPSFFGVSHAPPATYGAATLTVVADDSTLLADAPATGASANDWARAIAELSGKAPDTAYNAFIARVGSEVREATRNEANAQALTDAVQDRRESVAGVSLDEEMGNIIRFQRAYQASSRAMSTMDEMLDVLINRTGRVGL
jgi:flagellar hook-associated protein 1